MLTQRQHLLLAVSIAEWDTTLHAMGVMHAVPYPEVAMVRDELHDLILMWPGVRLPLTEAEGRRVIRDARRYCTEHGDELDDLLRDE